MVQMLMTSTSLSLEVFKNWRPAQYFSSPEEKQAMLLGPPLFYKQNLLWMYDNFIVVRLWDHSDAPEAT
jgi:hypothetical protein